MPRQDYSLVTCQTIIQNSSYFQDAGHNHPVFWKWYADVSKNYKDKYMNISRYSLKELIYLNTLTFIVILLSLETNLTIFKIILMLKINKIFKIKYSLFIVMKIMFEPRWVQLG